MADSLFEVAVALGSHGKQYEQALAKAEQTAAQQKARIDELEAEVARLKALVPPEAGPDAG